MKRMTVSCDGYYVGEAYVDDNQNWNGALLPYFPFDEAEKVAQAMTEDEEATYISDWHYDEESDCFVLHNSNYGVDEEFEGAVILTEDGEKRCYPIGAGSFGWVDHDWYMGADGR